MALNNFQTRALSGAVYVAAVVFLLMWGFAGQLLLTVIISLFCTVELLKLQKSVSYLNIFAAILLNLLLIMMHPEIHLKIQTDVSYYQWVKILVGAGMMFILLVAVILMFRHGIFIYNHLAPVFFSIIYIGIPCLLFLLINDVSYDFRKPLLVFILTWSSDTFAYLAGRALGKRKLFEELSPKKTIEGFAGGVFLTAMAGAVLGYFWKSDLAGLALLGAFVSVAGTAGDLFESALKRQADIKDSGRFLPGHGGALDRFDAFLFVCIVVFIWSQFIAL